MSALVKPFLKSLSASLVAMLSMWAAPASAQVVLGYETKLTLDDTNSAIATYFSSSEIFGGSLYLSTDLEDVYNFFASNSTSLTSSAETPYEYSYVPVYMIPSVSGEYTFGQIAAPTDTVLYFYLGAFDPEDFAANFIGGNDDYQNGFGQTTIPDAVTLGQCGGQTSLCPVTTVNLSTGPGVQYYTMVLSHYSEGASKLSYPLEVFAYGPGSVTLLSSIEDLNTFLLGDPEDPTDPTDTEDPTDPVDPTDPTDPVDPTDPTDPGPVAAQKGSTLERILAAVQSPGRFARINGTFANIAETVPVYDANGQVALAIDGSILNVVAGASAVAASAASATAQTMDEITLNIGDMATTALGAVNTGTIVLGASSASDQATTMSTAALRGRLDQLGGGEDIGVLVLNSSSNTMAILGSVTNLMTAVNGTVGDISTTALGAVNTGSITSGVDATVGSIVGLTNG